MTSGIKVAGLLSAALVPLSFLVLLGVFLIGGIGLFLSISSTAYSPSHEPQLKGVFSALLEQPR